MKKFAILITTLLVGSILFSACTPSGGEPAVDEGDSGEVKTFYVGPETAECEGEGPQTCLLVKESPDADYQFFYSSIDGFNYEPGYEYELLVQVDPVENPPAGGSSLSYTLVEEVSKTPVETTSQGEVKTLYVGPETAECVGVAPQTCLLVKESPDADYQFFYSNIDGFNYEPGYEYELLVQVDPVENPPADGSSLSYTLVEEVSKTPVETTNAPLEGTLWQLTGYTNADGEMIEALPDVASTATFEDGTISGSDGCNNFNAGYTVDGESLTVMPGASTLMACAPPVDAQAAGFNAALAQAASYSIDGTTLTLADAEGTVLATFEAVEPLSLTDTVWQVVSYNNGKEAVVSVILGTEITAEFTPDGALAGDGGCNSYFGSYEVDGESISIGQMGMTEMACMEPEGVMDQEQQFLAALQTAATYRIQADKLEMRTADGALAVSFVARPAATLAGSSWDVISYNNGSEAVVSVIIGTELTAEFVEDGRLSGSAGCNTYNASYETDGDSITIGPAASTRMACGEPEGIMEQEMQYLAALETAATYRIDGDRMEMRTADGALVASFQAR